MGLRVLRIGLDQVLVTSKEDDGGILGALPRHQVGVMNATLSVTIRSWSRVTSVCHSRIGGALYCFHRRAQQTIRCCQAEASNHDGGSCGVQKKVQSTAPLLSFLTSV